MGFLLTWTEGNSAEDGHRIYRSTAPMDPANLPAPVAEVGADVTSYEDAGVTDGQTYYYRVSAFTAGGVNMVSSEIQVTAVE